ncbi:MAG: zinc ribbon domain-containing protein [Phycisphaerae bacterium]|nr:zinc ribbon domain-containing protein [Phycisphaerae bacterium]
MPTYDYECQACGHAFEKFQSITARPVRKCPKCGRNKAKRLIGTGAGVIFKGSGFYQTDYRKSPPPKGEGQGSGGDGGSKDGDGGSGDGKDAGGGKADDAAGGASDKTDAS